MFLLKRTFNESMTSLKLFKIKLLQLSSRTPNFKRLITSLPKAPIINGKYTTSTTGETFSVKNPFDDSVLCEIPDLIVDDAIQAVNNSYEAFQSWKETTAKERSSVLKSWFHLVQKNLDYLSELLTLEQGKPLAESKAEVLYGASYIEWFAEECRRIKGEIIPSPDKSKELLVYRFPIGVVGLITPWNFPNAMLSRKAAAAIACGCTCVAKPAEDTPLSAMALSELAHQAGLPKGVLNVVTSSRDNSPEIGTLFCTHDKVAGISFTGSTEVGKLLYSQCAQGVKRLSLELGSNSPFIVFESADLNKAVESVMVAKFRNMGQTCVSANKFLVQESIYEEFVSALKKAVQERFVLGNGMDSSVNQGPIVNHKQFKRIETFVGDALEKGADLVLGGLPNETRGHLYVPTIISNVKENMLVYNEEIFGPVVSITKFKDEEEAIEKSNDTKRGLAAYLFSSNLSQILRVSKALESGMVGVNEGAISMSEVPFGGVKESGFGREGSSHGVDEFTYLKYVCLGKES